MIKISKLASVLAISMPLLPAAGFAADLSPYFRAPMPTILSGARVDNGNDTGGGPPSNGGNSTPLALALTNAIPAWGTVGDNFTTSLVISGGTPSYGTWIDGGLPTGLALNGTSIDGILTAPGIFNFSIGAADTASLSALSGPFSVTIANPLQFGVWPDVHATVGDTVVLSPPVISGGTPPYGYSTTAEVSIDPNTGAILVPTSQPAQYSVIVSIEDAHGRTATSAIANVDISPPVVMAYDATSYGFTADTVGSIAAPAVSGGRGADTFGVTGGVLPAGMTLQSDGSITGTPSAVSAGSVTIQAADADGRTASQVLGWSVNMPIAVSNTANNFDLVQNVSSSNTVATATGGLTPVTWSITSGALPAGLTFTATDTSYTISGTPTATGTSAITLSATDALGSSASTSFSITVATPAPEVIWNKTVGGGTSLSLQMPTSYEVGDVLVLLSEFDYNVARNGVPGANGFNLINYANSPNSSYRSHAVEAKVVTSLGSLPGSITLPTNGSQQVFELLLIRNAKLSDASHVAATFRTGSGYNGGTGSLPGFTSTAPGLAIGFVWYRQTVTQNYSWADPAGQFASSITKIAEFATSAGVAGGISVARADIGAAKAFSEPSLTYTTGANVPMFGGVLVLSSK